MFASNLNLITKPASVADTSADTIKSELAARIVAVLDQRRLTVRSAGIVAATAAADLSRIRQGKLDRFTVDRLISILTRLDQSLEVGVSISQRQARAPNKSRDS